MRKFGLIGYPLSHSFSPDYFRQKFHSLKIDDAEYCLYPLEDISDVRPLLNGDIIGLNVTIPYKESVIPYLDDLTNEAKEIGAVNTIKISQGRKVGYNTDVYGFEASLKEVCKGVYPSYALILGTGGASKAVQYVLDKLGIAYLIVSRTSGDITYDQLGENEMGQYTLIVNTTPLGMYPDVDNCPHLPYEYMTSGHILIDLIYNPDKTLFLRKGESMGARIANGLRMLELQAEKSWQIWNDK